MQRRHDKFGLKSLALFLFLHLLASLVPAKRLPVRIFTSADGLGSSFVNFLARDSRGFMWFCTRDGLSRFDGSQFVTYRIGEENSPPGIEHILETRAGVFWITTTSGTFRFDPNHAATPDPTTPTLHAQHIFDDRGRLFEDRRGNLWLASEKLSRIEFNDGVVKKIPVDLGIPTRDANGPLIGAVLDGPDGSLWISTSAGLIRQLSSGRRVFYPDPEERLAPGGSVRLILDNRGLVWLARTNRLYVINPDLPETLGLSGDLITRPVEPTRTIGLTARGEVPLPANPGEIFQYRNPEFIDNRFAKELYQTSDGVVWISCENFLLELRPDRLNVHTSDDGLPSVMNDIAEDDVGNLWISGQSSLARLDRDGLVSFGTKDGAGSDRILAVFSGPNDAIHIATTDAHIASFDGTRFSSVRPQIGDSTTHLWTSRPTLADSRGDWWFLTSDKLFRFAGAANAGDLAGRQPSAVYGRDHGLASDGMFQIFEDSRGDVWVSTRGNDAALNGLSRMRAGETTFQRFGEEHGFPPRKSPSSFTTDANGDVWISLFEGGILRFDGERFHQLAITFAENSLLTDLLIDAKGRLWVTSATNGAIRIDDPHSANPTAEFLTNAQGLSSNNVRTVAEDRLGRIYFGTARGVTRLSPDTGHIRRYSVADGLPADFVSDTHRDSDGNIWFATNSGVARLIPVADKPARAPVVWLGAMRVAGESRPISELGATEMTVGELSDWQNNLQIEFFGIDFRAGEGLRYQYKLDGVDEEWSRPEPTRSVTFAKLEPGSYRFLVRGVNSTGVVSENPAVVSFTILPPIWQRWWFLALAAIIIGGILITSYRYRISNLRRVNAALLEAKQAEEALSRTREERVAELEQVRSRIATDLHDDVGSSLTQIAILSEVAQTQAGKANGKPDALKKISDVSNELVGTMSDIVWAINPAKDHLHDLTQRMRRVAADLLAPKGIAVHFSSREEDKAHIIKTNARREVFLIFKESVNNIAKHSGATHVYIDVEIKSDLLLLRIRDDGSGFVVKPPSFDDTFSSEGPSGNGVRNMRKRAMEMGGHFEIDSKPGGGTTTFLELPLDTVHAAEA